MRYMDLTEGGILGGVTARADALKAIPLFEGLNGRDREYLATNMDEVSYEAGAKLISQGQSNHTFYVLIDGEVEVSVSGERRRSMRPGDFFGEISMDKRLLATADVVAKTPVQALVMSRAQFRALSGPTLSLLQSAIADRLAEERKRDDDRARQRAT